MSVLIKKSCWSKEHVVEGIKYCVQNEEFKRNARSMTAYEFGVYRGEATQLIDNTFYAYQFPIGNIIGIDSFEGLPDEKENIERFYLFNKGMFSDVGSHLYPLRPNGKYVKAWFNQLTADDVSKHNMRSAAFVHIDGDLYISAIDAFNFLFTHNLIVPGTVIAFDEFKSTSKLSSGGESLAWFETCEKYKVEAEEIFRNIYYDRIECWQNVFVVKSIGEKVDFGLERDS